MRTAFAVLAVAYVSCASAYFEAGNTIRGSELLATHTDHVTFGGNGVKVYHFNTCRENNIVIDKVEVMTHRGKTIEGRLLEGGVDSFYAMIEVRGEGEANTETKFWGRWIGRRQELKIDQCFFVFDKFYPCDRPLKVYPEEHRH